MKLIREIAWFLGDFSPTERRGMLLLSVLIFLINGARIAWPLVFPPPEIEFKYLNKDEAFRRLEVQEQESLKGKNPVLFITNSFNPNKTKAVEFREMGFSSQRIHAIFTYKSEKGFFNSVSDFLSIDDFSAKEENLLQKFVDLRWDRETLTETVTETVTVTETETGTVTGTGKDFRKPELKPVNINSASIADLTQFNGIGNLLAERIIRFRDKLGGFYSPNQLYEVYHLDSAVVSFVKPYLKNFGVKQFININTTNADSMAKHPYIGKYLANRIIKYHEQHGIFNKPEELLNIYGVTPELYEKLKPYLKL
ncbi:MAG: hypothetical protein GC181_13685 [Bacteroidetes bacterium]|nr:hypothetical protein [Bacteroidota bacterium]